jgi:hypothetical protein
LPDAFTRLRFTLSAISFRAVGTLLAGEGPESSAEGRLGPGDANVEAFAFTCNPDGCFGTDVNRVMLITTAN